MTEDDIRERLQRELPRWRLADGSLRRTYKTSGWKSTLMVVNAIGHLAEAAWHHPDLSVSYAAVDVRLHTHEAAAVTAKDLELARKIEEVIGWQPATEGGALESPPQDPRHAYIKHDP